MKAAVITADGLKILDVPRPDPKPDEVLVCVRAAGVYRADLAMTSKPHRRYALSPVRLLRRMPDNPPLGHVATRLLGMP